MRRTIDDTALIEPFNSFYRLLTEPFRSNMYSSDICVYEPRFGDERHGNASFEWLELVLCVLVIDSRESYFYVHLSSSNGGSIKLSLCDYGISWGGIRSLREENMEPFRSSFMPNLAV